MVKLWLVETEKQQATICKEPFRKLRKGSFYNSNLKINQYKH